MFASSLGLKHNGANAKKLLLGLVVCYIKINHNRKLCNLISQSFIGLIGIFFIMFRKQVAQLPVRFHVLLNAALILYMVFNAYQYPNQLYQSLFVVIMGFNNILRVLKD